MNPEGTLADMGRTCNIVTIKYHWVINLFMFLFISLFVLGALAQKQIMIVKYNKV